ncbi:MAG: MogA/MoaB family molybdenum cofactor biosynthesis protein, partial [Elusimicrobia bacterium]|nr:MogA/MoaB family molybdenum cofactor biosynthesis protein [Elusimicrobiota bacterium]
VGALPGSRGGVRDGLTVLAELLPHALHVAGGGGH